MLHVEKMTDPICSRCGGPQDRPNQRYCRACHTKYERERAKRNTRAAHLVKKFGLVVPMEQVDDAQRDAAVTPSTATTS